MRLSLRAFRRLPKGYRIGTRRTYRIKHFKGDSTCPEETVFAPALPEDANLVGSMDAVVNGLHWPVLDFDFPCQLVPSTTPGHFHLYIEKAVPWAEYKHLLVALRDAGLLEPGYVSSALQRQQTMVRLPWVQKETS